MTFSTEEERLGRGVALAMRLGVTPSALGMTGTRSVGPLAQCVVKDGRTVYAVNNEHGITLGATMREALDTLRRLVREATQHTENDA